MKLVNLEKNTNMIQLTSTNIAKSFLLVTIIGGIFASCNNKEGTQCNTPPTSDGFTFCSVYHNDKLTELYAYENDTSIKEGPYCKFASNGDTLINAYFKHNKLTRSYYDYYPRNHVKSYVYFDFNSDTLYYRGYDINGKIIKQWGEKELFFNDGNTGISTLNLNRDSILEVISTVITPPKTKFKINSFITSDYDDAIDTIKPFKQYYLPDENSGIYSISFKLSKHGKYRVIVSSELNDPDRGMNWKKTEGYKFSFPTNSKSR